MKVVSIKEKVPVLENYKEEMCGDDEIIIQLRACGICGSDIRNFFYRIY